jgi:hypothetical protein
MRSRLVRFALVGAVVAGVLAVLPVFTATNTFAQIRAALVKNVDEAGRTPWTTRSQILPGSGCFGTSDCFNYSEFPTAATFDLPPVPAGKRWIVQSASGGLTNGAGHTLQIELGAPRPGGIVFDADKWIYAGPFFAGTAFSSAVFSTTTHVIFGPGETPFVRVSASPGMVGYSVITFSGYLIDATN